MTNKDPNTDLGTDPGTDNSAALQAQVEQAVSKKEKLNITGQGSKSFLGIINDATALDISEHSGIVSYEPTELVITARAGTTLKVINRALNEYNQTLAFEPPAYSDNATLGGTIACALAGPAKPYLGGTRDYILGCKVLTGHGKILQFGGEVMKNVAGYDVSRLMTGAMGTLGAILDISVKVLPRSKQEHTLVQETPIEKAIENMQALAGLGLPVTASAYLEGKMYTRLSGTESATSAAAKKLPGDKLPGNQAGSIELWLQLREHQLPFFNKKQSLWRISVPALTNPIDINGSWLYDWAGMQRWLFTDATAETVRTATRAVNGHATLFRADENIKREAGVFQPLPAPLLKLHQRLKQEFDPAGIFNHQRLFPEF